jgi:hypothetical protein
MEVSSSSEVLGQVRGVKNAGRLAEKVGWIEDFQNNLWGTWTNT